MTLGQAFTRAIELEVGYQLSEWVSLARPTEIMQVQEVEEVDETGLGQKRSKDVVCWQCGENGHLQHDCPHKETDDQVEGVDDPNAYAGRSEQIIRINQPITVAIRDNIYKQMGSQRTKANIYKAGYRKTRAAWFGWKVEGASLRSAKQSNPSNSWNIWRRGQNFEKPKVYKIKGKVNT